MSDASGLQKNKGPGSNVGEIKVELSHTMAHIERMMDTIQQLLQAKSADGGQQIEESGGTGRGDATDDSSSAGRATREERAATPRVSATTAIAAGGRVSNYRSRALDGSRPPDDTSQRSEVPVSVGPMINMQRGKAAHNGDGVLSSSFQRHPRVVPPVLKREKMRISKIKNEFLLKANMLGISGHFVGEGTSMVLVGDPLKQKTVLLREGFSREEIKGA